MATAPTLPLVSVDEYLNSCWHPDKEYIDGHLVDRSMPNELHSLLQVILIAYFRSIEKQHRLKVLSELRTEIVERARYRIPDVLVANVPLGRPLTKGPFRDIPAIIIEILSPDDTQKQVLARFADFSRLGVSYIIQMDPEECVAYRYQAGSLIRTEFTTLTLPGCPDVPFDSNAIFEQLRTEIADMEGGEGNA
jgi:Uma2 family endonuclease